MLIGMKNFWVVAPTPDKTYEITLAYNKEPETITDTTSTPRSSYGMELIFQINIKIYFYTLVW